jgi:hypothetical protein
MSKIPDKPQDVFVPLTQDYLKIFGNDLIALMIYGSAASGFYVKGKSDINLLVVLTPQGVDRLEDAWDTVKYWRKRNVATPWVMTRHFIESSLDAYPIEFLNLKINHLLIHGEDVLETLTFDRECLRLQIEREFKGKLILLRQGYLETEGDTKRLKQLIDRSVIAFVAVFKALLYLKQMPIPVTRRETVMEVAKLFSLDANVLGTCIEIKEKTTKLSQKDIAEVFKKYLRVVEKICDIIDKMS